MKKQVSPIAVAVMVVVLLGVVGFLFYKGTATPEPVNMSPQGPGAKLLQGGGRPGMTPDVIEAQKKQQQSQGGTQGQ